MPRAALRCYMWLSPAAVLATGARARPIRTTPRQIGVPYGSTGLVPAALRLGDKEIAPGTGLARC